MIVSINQPAYLPWLGYFQRIAMSDLHVVLDHVQFEKNSFTNRNKVRTAEGSCWLTVPLKTKGQFGELAINAIQIDEKQNWRDKHWRTLQQNYGKAPAFGSLSAGLEQIYRQEWTHLAGLCRELTALQHAAFGITTPLRYSSEMNPQKTKNELVLELCQQVGATTYLSGAMGRDYLDESAFASAGIRVAYQDYRHPEYPQCRGTGFLPYMAALDLLFNCGPQSRDILLRNQSPIADER